MADILNNWAIFIIAFGLLLVLPYIMLFGRKNQFDVKGKVRLLHLEPCSLA
jgi:hypothetical protein